MTNAKNKSGRPQTGLYMNLPNTPVLNQSFTYKGKYAIYGLSSCDESENILYIGFTSTKLFKRYNSHLVSSRNNRNPKEKWLNQLLAEGKKPVLIVLEDGIPYYEQACEKEKEYISFYTEQGAELLNRTLGGPGILGFQHSEETRQRLAEVHKRLAAEKRKKEVPTGMVAEIKMRLAS